MSRIPNPTHPPEPKTKAFALFLLRAGLGSSIFNQGLNDYLAILADIFPPGYPSTLPYLQIILGLALMLGVFTTPSAICAGLYILLSPFIQTAINIGGNAMGGSALIRGRWSTFPYFEPGMASHLLLIAAVLWLSPSGASPWSFDSLVFKRNDVLEESEDPTRTEAPPARDVSAEPLPALSTGERAATSQARSEDHGN
ncbi:DoxX family protein [Singulisphaera rosea]